LAKTTSYEAPHYADFSNLLTLHFSPTQFSCTFLMAYPKVKIQSNGNKASPCFIPIRHFAAIPRTCWLW
jgi:hypothetical protein